MEKHTWADGPFKLVPSPKFTKGSADGIFAANEMAISHNIYIRGLNAIYLQAEGVTTPSEIKDFLTFCQIWVEVIHHHHHIEEEVFFPGVEKALGQEGIMHKNLEQHKAFESGIEDFRKYATTTPGGYSGKELKNLINRFGKLLVDHLHEEITGLLDIQSQFDPKGTVLKTHYLLFEKKLVAQSSLSRHQAFIFGCRDVTFENGVNKNWPDEAPFFVPYLISWFLARDLAGVWRFLPSDFKGNPRRLQFLSQAPPISELPS
ncbi:hypothetical protein TCE0_060f18820 [Talaromyces pinophilus]|uniref:Hemerythrin-like domain-containing protein n=1 Tax=Talaromyces pinophilus TaxID=128442 RepID=A0A6V8HQ00_TALPI|nr:hypothetical protein DPV78_007914 [Talaromyces pinophilus]GAM43753.1 hypothetical protein TCE0_060f18820 [Talaromyces pinophilus]